MGYLVSIEDVTPPARADGNPWTQAKIEESSAQKGPWTVLAVIPITPVDADPEHPQVRSFSTDLATLTEGYYRLTVEDAVGGTFAMNSLPIFPKVFAPTVADVAVLLRARTTEGNSEAVGTFTLNTRPTAVEVQGLIAKAVAAVSALAVVTFDSPPAAILEARNAAALYTAMLIELSYFPEQVRSDQSAYDDLKVLYGEAMERLVDILPDTSSLKKGIYSLRLRSDIGGVLSTAEQLP